MRTFHFWIPVVVLYFFMNHLPAQTPDELIYANKMVNHIDTLIISVDPELKLTEEQALFMQNELWGLFSRVNRMEERNTKKSAAEVRALRQKIIHTRYRKIRREVLSKEQKTALKRAWEKRREAFKKAESIAERSAAIREE